MKNIKTFFKSAGLAVLGGLWASQRQEANYVTEICMHGFNFLAVTSYCDLDVHTDGQGQINSSIDPNHEYMYFIFASFYQFHTYQ